MITAGIRDLKNQLPKYIELVKKGGTIIVTDRGKPVAILQRGKWGRFQFRPGRQFLGIRVSLYWKGSTAIINVIETGWEEIL